MMCLEPQQEKPAESKFCFLKLPIVFGYAVPFAAISKKQNRKGSPQSLIYPLKGKLTFFMIKQFFHFEKGTSDSHEIPPIGGFAPNGASRPMQIKKQTPFMPLYAPCFLRKTSTCAEMTVMRSHWGCNPRVLRMTKSADGHLPSIIAYRRRQKQLELFLLGFVRFRAASPQGWYAQLVTKSA